MFVVILTQKFSDRTRTAMVGYTNYDFDAKAVCLKLSEQNDDPFASYHFEKVERIV